MRVEAGHYRHVSTNGTEIHVDRPLSQQQTDLIVCILQRADLAPHDTTAIEWDGESPVIVEHVGLEVDPVTRMAIVHRTVV